MVLYLQYLYLQTANSKTEDSEMKGGQSAKVQLLP
jgi:hypothetical protein